MNNLIPGPDDWPNDPKQFFEMAARCVKFYSEYMTARGSPTLGREALGLSKALERLAQGGGNAD